MLHRRESAPPTAPILIILHQEHSTPGRVGHALIERGFTLDVRRPRFGDPLPETMAEHAGAIIFGGPMSANDAKATRTPTACCQRPKRSTTSVPSATVPTQVSFSKKVVNQETRLSRKVAKPLKIAKTKFGCGVLRLSLSQV